jgi:hypothetical protein
LWILAKSWHLAQGVWVIIGHTPLCQENTGKFFFFFDQLEDREGPVTGIKCWAVRATALTSCPDWLATASQAGDAFFINLLLVAKTYTMVFLIG